MNEDDLFILPKDAFTIGDAEEFKEFICEKANVTCRFIPVKLGNKLSSAFLHFKINYNRMNEEAESRQKQMLEEKKRKNTRKK